MAEEIRNGKKRGFAIRALIVLGTLLLMAVVYVSAILLQIPEDETDSHAAAEKSEPVSRMQPAAMNDASALAQLFGAPLPCLPGYAMNGQGDNVNYEGANARIVTLQYPGFILSAVRPAAAAPLLLREDLSVSLQSGVVCLSLPVVLAAKGDSRCAYFSGADAAYAVYAPQAGEENFLSLLDRLQWSN